MSIVRKARVFKKGRSQAVIIPAEFQFNSSEVYIRRNKQTQDLILSPVRRSWDEIFAQIDKAKFPAEFMADRNHGAPEDRR